MSEDASAPVLRARRRAADLLEQVGFSMRDGAFVDETRLTGGTTGHLGSLAGLEG